MFNAYTRPDHIEAHTLMMLYAPPSSTDVSIIEHKIDGDSDVSTTFSIPAQNSIRLTFLKPNMRYQWRLSAVNSCGESEMSDASDIVTTLSSGSVFIEE